VQVVGHRDVPGRPALLGTTEEFLGYFDLGSLRDLPEMMKKRELGEIAKEMNLVLPMENNESAEESKKSADETCEGEVLIGENQQPESAEVIELHPSQASAENPEASDEREDS
jgi:segregation and condensation protein B